MIETVTPEDWEELWAQAVLTDEKVSEHIQRAEDRITRTLEKLKAAKK